MNPEEEPPEDSLLWVVVVVEVPFDEVVERAPLGDRERPSPGENAPPFDEARLSGRPLAVAPAALYPTFSQDPTLDLT